jgi:uncharacterized membrane protein HdeD (DUF308 family)
MLLEALGRNWWLVALRGLLAILFGLAAFVWPGLTLVVLVLLFGAYALADGVMALIAGWMHRRGRSGWWMVFEGLFGIAIGVVTFLWPAVAALALLSFIAAWAVVTGIFEIAAAVRLRHVIDNEWALALGGLLSVAVGVAIFVWPQGSALALVWLIGAYAILFGILLLAFAFRLRSWHKGVHGEAVGAGAG